MRGLLHQLDDLAVGADGRDAELARIVDVRQQDLRRHRCDHAVVGAAESGGLERIDELRQALLQEIVAEVHHEVVVAEVVARDEDAVGEAEGRVLVDVGDVDAPARAVTDRGDDLVARVADDDPDLFDARRDHVFEPVEQDRLVRHRHELLRVGVGDGSQPRAGASAEDQTLHVSDAR